MATQRKKWFKVADSVQHEDWSNDVAATFLRLLAHMNTRWAREGKDPSSACSVSLSRANAMLLTGSGSLARARSILRELSTHVSLTLHEQGTSTSVEWPNYAIFQGLASGSGAAVKSVTPEAVPPPQDAKRKTQDADARQKKRAPKIVESREEQLADPALIDSLAATESKMGIRYKPEDIAEWLRWVTPDLLGWQQRDGKPYVNMRAAAKQWWRRVKPDDIKAAIEAGKQRDWQRKMREREEGKANVFDLKPEQQPPPMPDGYGRKA
mgnify:CR=1 FL=1